MFVWSAPLGPVLAILAPTWNAIYSFIQPAAAKPAVISATLLGVVSLLKPNVPYNAIVDWRESPPDLGTIAKTGFGLVSLPFTCNLKVDTGLEVPIPTLPLASITIRSTPSV